MVHYKIHLFNFLNNKGIFLNETIFNYASFLEGLDFCGWNLFLSKYAKFFVSISRDNIRNYKNTLKSILKLYGNKNLFFTLLLINKEILKWCSIYKVSECFYDVCGEIDLYLYRILWNFLRKRHIRRNRTWVYLKYWKYCFGRWVFFLVDNRSGRTLFLKSNSSLIKKIYRLPSSLNIFNIYNQNKLNTICFKRINNLIQGVYKILWKKQSGLCICCLRVIDPFNFNTFKLVLKEKNYNLAKSNSLYNFSLIHIHCRN